MSMPNFKGTVNNNKSLKLFRSSVIFIFAAFAGLILISFIPLNTPKAYASGILGLELKGGAYFQHLSGNVSVGNSGSSLVPTNITPSDIGLPTSKTEPMFKAVLLFLYTNRVSFTYVPYTYGGSKIISRSINFNGQTYTANTQVNSKLDLYSYKLFFTHNFSLDRYVALGLGIGVNAITAKAELDAPILGYYESRTIDAPIPLIGARLKIAPLDFLSIIGKIQGFTIGSRGYYEHVNAGINYYPIKPLAVFADYVYDKVHVNVSNVDGSLTFAGPEIGLKLRF